MIGAGGVLLGIFGGDLREKESASGRAVLKPTDWAIPARLNRFRNDEPKHEANLARSVFVELKHARSKLLGLAAVIQSRIERRQSRGGRNDVSRETIVISVCFS